MPDRALVTAAEKGERRLLVADLFCGAGGSSTGARRALRSLGYGMTLVAVNHWNVAIETHSRNHPEARHYLRDLASADPIALVPEGKLDLLMASPTCTHHSRARGGRPSSDQQRMDPWAIVRWCSELRIKRLLVENVPEFVDWGPINLVSGRPLKRRKGEYFRTWVEALRGLGFRVECRILNCADYGDATTRVRFFLLARSDGKRIAWPAPTHSRDGGDLFGSQRWRAARDIIDWSLPGQSIYGRKRPLAAATLARIYAGAVKFKWPDPYLVVLRRHMAAQSLDAPLPTLCAAGHIGLAEPFLLNRHGDNGAARGHSLAEPMPTADCRGAGYLVEPIIFPANQSRARSRGARTVAEPLPTITATGTDLALAEPFLLPQRSDKPARTVDAPAPTITTAHRGELAVIVAAHGEREGQAPRIHSVDDPCPTICATGRVQLAQPDALTWDIRFRMLQPHELAAAMGFTGPDAEYEFAGNKTEITRQIGNAVPVNTACALVRALCDTLAGRAP